MAVNLELFLLYNASMNALLLLLSGRVGGLRAKLWRVGLAAALGAVYAAVSCLEPFYLLQGWAMKLLCAGCMTALAFLPVHWRRAVTAGLCFFLCAFLLGGLGLSFMFMLGARGYGWHIALPLAALGALGCVALAHMGRRMRLENVMRYVEIDDHGKEAGFLALVDTGNQLTEPVSGLPVMVVERRALGDIARQEGRPVAFRALSGDGALLAFAPQRIRIDGREAPPMMVAACEEALCSDKRYAALLPWSPGERMETTR